MLKVFKIGLIRSIPGDMGVLKDKGADPGYLLDIMELAWRSIRVINDLHKSYNITTSVNR